MKDSGLLNLFDAQRDGHVGRTIVRLARMAAARHRFEAALELMGDAQVESTNREVSGRIEGLDPRTVATALADASAAGRAGTDGDRNVGSPPMVSRTSMDSSSLST